MSACLALALLTIGAAPAAASPQTVEPLSVSGSIAVPAGATRTLTLTCPKVSVALSGAATGLPARDYLPGNGPRRWTFRFEAGGAPRTAGAVLRCVRLRLPRGIRGIGLIVGTMWSPQLNIPPHGSQREKLRCASGQIATGWGLQRGADPAAGGVAVTAAVPSGQGYVFVLKNTGARAAGAVVHLRCLQRSQPAPNGKRHSFATRVARFRDRVAGGAASHSCRPSEFSLSAGASLDPRANVLLGSSYPSGERAARWMFAGAPGGGSAKTVLICLSKATRFR